MIPSTIKGIFFLLILSGVTSADAGVIYCKTEVLPNGKRHHIFTNSNVNVDNSFRVLDYGEHAQEADNSKSMGAIPGWATKISTHEQTEKNNPYNDKAKEIMDKIIRISGNLSGNLLERKYQLKEIEALNGTLRSLGSSTSMDKSIPGEGETEEQKGATQQVRVPANIIPRAVFDVTTGQHMIPAAGGVIEPQSGTFHQDVGAGYVNTKTGAFSPKIGP